MKSLRKFGMAAGLILSMTLPAPMVLAEQVSLIDVADDVSLRVVVDSINEIEKTGSLADITIQERAAGDLTYSSDADERTIVLSLEGTDYSFKNLPNVKLSQGFGNAKAAVEYLSEKGKAANKTIVITLPRKEVQASKGQMLISNLKVETAGAVKSGVLKLKVGRLEEQEYTEVKVAETLAYGAALKVDKEYSIKTGDSTRVAFTLQEGMPDSLASSREMDVAVNKGFFKTDEKGELIYSGVYLNGRNITSKVEIDTYADKQQKATRFSISVPGLEDDVRDEIRIEGLELSADLGETGNIMMTVSGRDLEQDLKAVIASIDEGTSINVERIETPYDVKRQTGGAVIISEEAKRSLEMGTIRLAFEGAPYVEYTRLPNVEVTEGNIELKTIGWKDDNVLELRVTKKSTLPSTIVISDFTYNVSDACPSGSFNLTVSGSSLSPEVENAQVMIKDFMRVTEKKATVPAAGGNNLSGSSRVTKFTLNRAEYELNGVSYPMDAAAFSQGGRTMVPVRYVADAAGIDDNAIKYDKGVITIMADKTITLYLGSRLITCGSESYLMETEPVSVSGRTYVPVSEIAKMLGIQVKWDAAAQTAIFTK